MPSNLEKFYNTIAKKICRRWRQMICQIENDRLEIEDGSETYIVLEVCGDTLIDALDDTDPICQVNIGMLPSLSAHTAFHKLIKLGYFGDGRQIQPMWHVTDPEVKSSLAEFQCGKLSRKDLEACGHRVAQDLNRHAKFRLDGLLAIDVAHVTTGEPASSLSLESLQDYMDGIPS